MDERKHTPGPWVSDGKIVGWLCGDAPAVAVRYESSPNMFDPVCMVQPHLSGKYGVAGSRNPVEDAQLIAAAPALLEACIAAERDAALDACIGEAAYQQLVAAIALASPQPSGATQ